MSKSHMNAGGYTTFVRSLLGHKLWIVSLGKLVAGPNGWPVEEALWQAIVLGPQDDQ